MTFYLPILPGPYGVNSTDRKDVWMQECPLNCLTRKDVVEQIHSGQFDCPARVLEIDEEAGTVKDVTEEIAEEVGDLTFGHYQAPWDGLRDWLDEHKAGYFSPRAAE